MAGKGGKRPGAGRKPSAEKKAAAAVKAVVDARLSALPSSMSPLEVILECMNEARGAGDTKAAANYANMAAPYIHPKLSSITSNNIHNGNLTIVTEFPA
jgi:hypothetical protein